MNTVAFEHKQFLCPEMKFGRCLVLFVSKMISLKDLKAALFPHAHTYLNHYE